MERKLCPAAAALAGGTGVTAEEGALDRAPRPSITCSELCRRSRSRLRGSCRSASGAGTAASRRQLPVLLLSGSAGTGAERVGVTDTRRLPRACAGAGIRWGSPAARRFLGSEVGSVNPPPCTSEPLPRGAPQTGWQQVPERFPWLGEPPGCSLGLERGMPCRHYTRAIPNFPAVGFGCPGSPVSRANGAVGAGCARPPIFPGKHQLQSCCLASASPPGAESKLQSPV